MKSMDAEAVQVASDKITSLGCKIFRGHQTGNRRLDETTKEMVGEVGIFCLEGDEVKKCVGYGEGECMKFCPLHLPIETLIEIIGTANE